jgi:hypothetical protein
MAWLLFGAAGLASALVVWWVWGSCDQVPRITDEAAYLLQAQIFATGRWVIPGPPHPEFFEQNAVLVTPVMAAKYPPGHSLLMAPGVWLGLPGLVPLLLTAASGALVLGLSRRIGGTEVGLITWSIWLTASGNLQWRASYFSEVTTAFLWLAGWWALLEWQVNGGRRWLIALAACIGWGAITRPLTTIAFAIPAGFVVLSTVRRRGTWSDMALGGAVGGLILCLIPLWNLRTIGRWNETPLSVYTRTYIPFDRLGFGLDSTPPLRPLPPDRAVIEAEYREVRDRFTPATLPDNLRDRLLAIEKDMWGEWRVVLLPAAFIGLVILPTPAIFALACSVLLIAVHLLYYHKPKWTIYYLELYPVLAFITALGLWWAIKTIAKRLRMSAQSSAATLPYLALYRVAAVVCTSVLILGALRLMGDVVYWRARSAWRTAAQRSFREQVRALNADKAIVFVRYAPDHFVHSALINNEPLDRARAWLVYDRGVENEQLIEAVPQRTPFLYDEVHKTLLALPPSKIAASR